MLPFHHITINILTHKHILICNKEKKGEIKKVIQRKRDIKRDRVSKKESKKYNNSESHM